MTLPVIHTPCGAPVALTEDNRIVEPDTDLEHQCPAQHLPYRVVRRGTRWTLEHVLEPDRDQPIYDTRHDAQADADKRNRAYHQAHAPRSPQPAKPDLFSNQEAI